MSKKIKEPSGQAGNRGGPPYEPTMMFGSKEETMKTNQSIDQPTNQPTSQQTIKQSVKKRPKR